MSAMWATAESRFRRGTPGGVHRSRLSVQERVMDRVSVQTNVLKANQEAATENRRLFEAEGTVVINLMSAPGAGKTSLLVATIQGLRDRYRLAVIEGDLQTD